MSPIVSRKSDLWGKAKKKKQENERKEELQLRPPQKRKSPPLPESGIFLPWGEIQKWNPGLTEKGEPVMPGRGGKPADCVKEGMFQKRQARASPNGGER